MANIDLGSHELVHLFNVNGLRLLQGSDHHIALGDTDAFAAALIEQSRVRNSDAMILNGDLYHTSSGEAAQEAIGDLLRDVGRKYEAPVIYVPGNHCLRGAGDAAWERFGSLPPNVHAPLEDPIHPVTLDTAIGKIVFGNLFYDFEFVNPAIFGLAEDEIHAFYEKGLPDGEYLLGGRTDQFRDMANNMVQAIQPDTKILITHCLPHPALAQFRMAMPTDVTRRLEADHGINFLYGSETANREFETATSTRWGMTVEGYRDWWNMKGFCMGSNVLERNGFVSAPEGLNVISGHNHASEYGAVRNIGGKSMTFYSHQGPFGM